MVEECKCVAVATVVMVNGDDLCGRCRKPLGEQAQAEVESVLAESREITKRIGGASVERNSLVRDNDPDWVPPEHRTRHSAHDPSLSDRDIEKNYADHAAEMRSRGTGKNGRVSACIPPELHAAKKRIDKHYWDDPKNLAKHKDFIVHG